MEPNDAAENLQVIRTLMERSAVYRRALAPVMLTVGIIGAVAAPLGVQFGDSATSAFVFYWSGVCAVAVAVALSIVRRQAIKSNEPFWSAPTRRVATAMFPALFAGATVGHAIGFFIPHISATLLIPFWLLFYGSALHAAGMFISAGTRRLGWVFIAAGIAVIIFLFNARGPDRAPHAMMGLTFGGLHLAAAAYLFLTERRAKMP